jgi:hypothetical protein
MRIKDAIYLADAESLKRISRNLPNNALHQPLDSARLALPLQAACVKRR